MHESSGDDYEEADVEAKSWRWTQQHSPVQQALINQPTVETNLLSGEENGFEWALSLLWGLRIIEVDCGLSCRTGNSNFVTPVVRLGG